MKRLLLIALVAGVVPVALAQTSETQTPAPTPEQTALTEKRPLSDSFCLRETGSRIVARQRAKGEKRCNAMAGRAYTREDLDRTGHFNVADALRTLDPSVY